MPLRGRALPSVASAAIEARAALDRRGVRETLVEHHRDVRSELRLDVRRLLRREQMGRAVEDATGTGRPPRSMVRRSARLNT